jgi:hypothetical protein
MRVANRAAPTLPTVKFGEDFDSGAATARHRPGNDVAHVWLPRSGISVLTRCCQFDVGLLSAGTSGEALCLPTSAIAVFVQPR